MPRKYIPQFEPWLGHEELMQLNECIRDNWITGGPKVKEFEERIARMCQVKHAIACCNGTMALYMGLIALGIGPGDDVIVPDFTFIASANAVVMTGAKPVFVDVLPDTFNIDVKSVLAAITPKTKAIMPVHIYGQATDFRVLANISASYKLALIEDAAQGVGVTYNNIPVGGIGDVGTLSFYADKTLTTGEGGMVLTDNDAIATRCLQLSHQGNTSKGTYIHDSIGYNFRMTDLQAAIGLAQLGKLPAILKMKKENELLYRKLLEGVVGFQYIIPECDNVPFRVVVLVDDPEGLSIYLEEKGIGTKRVFYPLHRQPCYNTGQDLPGADSIYNSGLSLPSSARLSHGDIDYVCSMIKEYYS